MKLQHLWIFLGILLLVVLQAGVFNYIYLFRYATPCVYLFALLLFNVNSSKSWLTLAGALIGLSVDMLGGTPGLHMAATTLTGFLRNYLLAPFVDIESNLSRPPAMRIHGRGVWLAIAEMVVIHQTVLYALDAWRGVDLSYFAIRLSSGSLFTYLSVMILQMVFLERSDRHRE